MQFDLDAVRRNVRRAGTEDLLDRATVYRVGMEPAALEVIEAELRERGLSGYDLLNHQTEREADTLLTSGGVAERCDFCELPAVTSGWGWHYFWGRVPVFPRRFRYCARHRAGGGSGS